MIGLAVQYGRYGYLRIAALLCDAGWQVNDKCVGRLSNLKAPRPVRLRQKANQNTKIKPADPRYERGSTGELVAVFMPCHVFP